VIAPPALSLSFLHFKNREATRIGEFPPNGTTGSSLGNYMARSLSLRATRSIPSEYAAVRSETPSFFARLITF
jgi:hypothetical protein